MWHGIRAGLIPKKSAINNHIRIFSLKFITLVKLLWVWWLPLQAHQRNLSQHQHSRLSYTKTILLFQPESSSMRPIAHYALNSWRCVLALATKLDISLKKRKKPESGDPNLGAWITENHRVKSWLIDSMSPSLMQWFIRLSTAKEIWEAISKTFHPRRNLYFWVELEIFFHKAKWSTIINIL